MPYVVLFPALALVLVLASVLSPARLGRLTGEVHGLLPGLADTPIPKPKPKPTEKVVATISLLQLRDARYRRGQALEDWIMDLDGKYIAIEGYMAIGTLEGLSRFEFVPEECECGGSKVNHFVDVTLTEGVTRFKPGRFYMRGYFSAGEVIEDGFVTSVYRMRSRAVPD
ncbi:MAG: hypothetical protein R3F49_09835 [Planctomycetota bacterium]